MTATPSNAVKFNKDTDGALWPWMLGAAAVLLVAIVGLARRRRLAASEPAGLNIVDPEPAPVPTPAPEPSPAPERRGPPPAMFERRGSGPRQRLVLDVRPIRVGLNLISATLDCEVTVANRGDAPALDVSVGLGLQSMQSDAEPDLSALLAGSIKRPATPAFDLSPGQEHCFRALAALPLADLHPVQVAGRPMFVPLVALSAAFRDGEAARQVGQAFVVGVERVDSAKLAPLWLDQGTRHYDGVAARPHGPVWQDG